MTYQFDTQCAVDVGVERAVLIWNIGFWVAKNKANDVNKHDDRYWTYNSGSAFADMFPFWSQRKIERMLKSLCDEGWLLAGNYNQMAYDRTKWYTISDKSIARKWGFHSTILTDGLTGSVEPIPDNKPDTKQDNKHICNYVGFLKEFNSLTGKKIRVMGSKAERQYKALIAGGYSEEDILSAVRECMKDDFHKKNPKYLTPEFITRSDKFQKFLLFWSFCVENQGFDE